MNTTQKAIGVGFLGATACVAAVDGGLSNLILSGILGAGTYKGHQALVAGDYDTLKAEIQHRLAEAENAKEKNHRLIRQLKTAEGALALDQGLVKASSIGLGLVTFISPIIGLSAIGLMALGKCSRYTRDNQ